MGCSIQILLLLALVVCHTSDLVLGQEDVGGEQSQPPSISHARVKFYTPRHHHRDGRGNRGIRCPTGTLGIFQSRVDPLPSGLPQHLVQICNTCATNCTAYDIHLSCGWFASARLIDPRDFRRLRFNDCLVNDGKELEEGRCLSFTYSETYPYLLAVSSIRCKHPH
ncbi:hypothetical protein MKX01_014253 [Papaver californicum]|nr:hypothetical protein MKX01_014253 [Papaver californicum]